MNCDCSQEFMVRLTQKQTTIGNVLHDGNCLLQQLQLSDSERRHVDTHMIQLSNGWEELRLKAMERQAKWVDRDLLYFKSGVWYIVIYGLCCIITVSGKKCTTVRSVPVLQ